MKIKSILFYELILIIASVLIFRGLWSLIDMLPFMHGVLAHFLSLLAGIIFTLFALVKLNKILKIDKNKCDE